MNRNTFRYAIKTTLPVLAGYIVLGIGFGILLQSKGYNFLWAILMSFTIYAGSMQYVAVDLLSGGATLISTAIITFTVNARHIFYGISMLEKYKGTGKIKPYLIFSLTDETFSLVCRENMPDEINKKLYYAVVSVFNQLYWIIGCTLGGLLGSLIEFNSKGIEFSMTALFVVIFTDQWMNHKEHIPALCGIFLTIICRLIFGADNFIIPSMLAIAAALLILRKKLDKEEGK